MDCVAPNPPEPWRLSVIQLHGFVGMLGHAGILQPGQGGQRRRFDLQRNAAATGDRRLLGIQMSVFLLMFGQGLHQRSRFLAAAGIESAGRRQRDDVWVCRFIRMVDDVLQFLE